MSWLRFLNIELIISLRSCSTALVEVGAGLRPAMEKHGVAVEEEAVIEDLLADLGGESSL